MTHSNDQEDMPRRRTSIRNGVPPIQGVSAATTYCSRPISLPRPNISFQLPVSWLCALITRYPTADADCNTHEHFVRGIIIWWLPKFVVAWRTGAIPNEVSTHFEDSICSSFALFWLHSTNPRASAAPVLLRTVTELGNRTSLGESFGRLWLWTWEDQEDVVIL